MIKCFLKSAKCSKNVNYLQVIDLNRKLILIIIYVYDDVKFKIVPFTVLDSTSYELKPTVETYYKLKAYVHESMQVKS